MNRLILAMALCGCASISFAQTVVKGDDVAKGCKKFSQNSREDTFSQGTSAGIFMSIASFGSDLPVKNCVPRDCGRAYVPNVDHSTRLVPRDHPLVERTGGPT